MTDRDEWLRALLLDRIKFYVWADATAEEVGELIDSLSESDEYDANVAALVQMPKWCSPCEAQKAVDREFAALSAAPDREAIAPEWRTIDSAPKDGTWLLLAEQESAEVEPSLYAGAWHSEGYWIADCGQNVTQTPEPTHWMPRPFAPLSLSRP